MDYTEDELFAKLERADAAGDVEAAKVIADEIRRIQSPVALQKPKPKESVQDLYSRAMQGDEAARQSYDVRAQTYGQPTFEQSRKEYSPIEGQGAAQNAWQSWGRFLPNLARNFDSPEEVSRARELDEPLLSTGGGMAGNIASNLAAYAGPQAALTRGFSFAGAAAPYLSGAGVGAVAGGAEPVGVGETRGGNAGRAAIWGVGGQAAGDLIGAGARALTPRMTAETAQLLDKAADFGIKPDVGQVSQNALTRQAWNQLGRIPFSGQVARDEANRIAFNKGVSKAYGESVEKLTPEANAKAMNAIGKTFDDIRAKTSLNVTPGFISQLKQTRANVASEVGEDAAKIFDGWAAKLLNGSKNGKISGTEYQAWHSKVSKLKLDGYGNHSLDALKQTVDDAATASMPKELRGQWQEARKKWAIGSTIEPLITKGAGSGDIPPAQLLGAISKTDVAKKSIARGKGGTLTDLANIGQRFLKEPPDSGTAGRVGTLAALQAVARNPTAQALGVGGAAYGAEKQGLVTPGQLGWLATALLGNRALMKTGASQAVIRGTPQKAIESTARKVLPKVAVPYALTGTAAADEKKKKAKKP